MSWLLFLTQNDIIGIYSTNGDELVKYFYDAWGNFTTQIIDNGSELEYTKNELISRLNPFRYRSYCYDEETNLYYLNSRYYDPEVCRFINADDISTLDVTQIANNGLNLFAYCLNNPVNETDENGDIPNWLKWLLFGIGAVLVVAAVAVVTVASGGAALGVFGTIALGAAKGALIGATAGTVIGAVIGGATNDWSLDGIIDGALMGFGLGAIAGAVIGASISGAQIYKAANMWGSTTSRTSFQNMVYHFEKHVLREKHMYLGRNVIEYTKNAINFYNANSQFMKLTSSGNYIIRTLFNGKQVGGVFDLLGKIYSFFS